MPESRIRLAVSVESATAIESASARAVASVNSGKPPFPSPRSTLTVCFPLVVAKLSLPSPLKSPQQCIGPNPHCNPYVYRSAVAVPRRILTVLRVVRGAHIQIPVAVEIVHHHAGGIDSRRIVHVRLKSIALPIRTLTLAVVFPVTKSRFHPC